MTNLCKLNFSILVYVHDENADDLGKDLAKWLLDEWLNGDVVIDVEYIDHEVKF